MRQHSKNDCFAAEKYFIAILVSDNAAILAKVQCIVEYTTNTDFMIFKFIYCFI